MLQNLSDIEVILMLFSDGYGEGRCELGLKIAGPFIRYEFLEVGGNWNHYHPGVRLE
jgi:hypothetical protein